MFGDQIDLGKMTQGKIPFLHLNLNSGKKIDVEGRSRTWHPRCLRDVNTWRNRSSPELHLITVADPVLQRKLKVSTQKSKS